MTLRRLQHGLTAFAALAATVMINMLYLQPSSGARAPRFELGPSPEAQARAIRGGEPRPDLAALNSQSDGVETTRAVQRELDARDYSIGTDDGVAGLVTRAAIMAYEYDHSLALTGEPTEFLLRTIVLGSANPQTATAANLRIGPYAEQVIRTTQQSLLGLGYGPMKVDGFLGEATVRAIRRFEREQGLPETGRISGLMVARLAKLAALGQVQAGGNAQNRR